MSSESRKGGALRTDDRSMRAAYRDVVAIRDARTLITASAVSQLGDWLYNAALLGYVAFHAGVGLLFLLSNVLRIAAGRVSPKRLVDLRLTRLWLHYTAATGAIAIGLVLTLPALVAMLGARP